MANKNAITLKKVENFKNNIIEFNKYLDATANEIMACYDGNPYCHEYSLNFKLYQKNKELIQLLEEYKKIYKEYRDWVGDKL